MTTLEGKTCSVAGCMGDARYPAPGHGHMAGCAYPYLSDGKEYGVAQNDPVNHPKHYTSHPSGVECIEITRHMGFNLGNAVKYIWRDGLKDSEVPIQDLKKALWYLQDEIKLREGNSDNPRSK